MDAKGVSNQRGRALLATSQMNIEMKHNLMSNSSVIRETPGVFFVPSLVHFQRKGGLCIVAVIFYLGGG